MKRFVKKIFLFVCGLLILYPICIIALFECTPGWIRGNVKNTRNGYGYLLERANEAKEYKNLDVLFLGSSLCYSTFNTPFYAEHGINSYNYGSSAQSHLQTEVILQRELQRLNPKLVIYEVSPQFLFTDGIESSCDFVSNTPLDPSLLKLIFKQKNLAVFNSAIYSSYKKLLTSSESKPEDLIRPEGSYIKRGFVERPHKYFKHLEPTPFKPLKQIKPQTDQLTAFFNNLEMLEEQGCSVALVWTPGTSYKYFSSNKTSWADSLYRTLDYSYLNYNQKLNLDDSLHFYDKGHLNFDGQAIFNKVFLNDLKGLLNHTIE